MLSGRADQSQEGLWDDKEKGNMNTLTGRGRGDEKLRQSESKGAGTRASQESEQIGERMNPTPRWRQE